jgi:iron complex transport system substrate-binding protein
MVADAAKAVRQVGAEPEQVLAAHPDLVITDEFTKAETQQLLERAGVAVRRTHPIHSFRDVADNIRMIGYVTGFPEAEDVIHQMHGRIYALKANAAAVGDWRVMTLDGALDTYGVRSLVDDVIRVTGATNVAAEHGVGPYRKLDVESVLAWRPDAIIVSGDPATTEVPEWLRQTPGLSLLPCVQKKHIVYVPGALLGSTSHHVVGAAEMIQAQLRRWGKP